MKASVSYEEETGLMVLRVTGETEADTNDLCILDAAEEFRLIIEMPQKWASTAIIVPEK